MFDIKLLDISIIEHITDQASKSQTDRTVGSMEGVNTFNCLKSEMSLQNFFIFLVTMGNWLFRYIS